MAMPLAAAARPWLAAYLVAASPRATQIFGAILLEKGLTPRHWLFWETMELAREIQALLSFPFLLFVLPLGMPLLTNNPVSPARARRGHGVR